MSDTFDKNYTRNKTSDSLVDNSDKYKDKQNVVSQEVKKLFSGKSKPTAEIDKLRGKYDEGMINKVYDKYHEELTKLHKHAKEFAKLMMQKYGNMPLYKLLKKAMKYKKHYNLSDGEYAEFQRIYEQELVGFQDKFNANLPVMPRTIIAKTLGHIQSKDASNMVIEDKDYGALQDILKLNAIKKSTHAQVILQSYLYRDCAPEALKGRLNREKFNPTNHIHPILAALFLPKIQILDDHMLFASISNIVKLRYEKLPMYTRPDYDLYHDLITDPNDVVCDIDSPIVDLSNRALLQADLWDSVLNLRNGRYYENNIENFITAVDRCRINMYDTPDLMYVRDEGAILRRLLSAFSFRPTIVSTFPIYSLVANNPYSRTQLVSDVTAIPMITLRLPINLTRDNTAVRMEDALDQAHWFLENGVIIPKRQSIIYSRGVLIFYINRRYQGINVTRLMQSYNFNRLPMTIAGFERLNDKAVAFEETMPIMNDTYKLRSVVLVEKACTNDLIVGTSAVIIKYRDDEQITEDQYYMYDPLGAGKQFLYNGALTENPPITVIPGRQSFSGTSNNSFVERAREKGTVFIYQKIMATCRVAGACGNDSSNPFVQDL